MSSTKRTPDEPGRGPVAPDSRPSRERQRQHGRCRERHGQRPGRRAGQPGAAEGGPPEAVTGSARRGRRACTGRGSRPAGTPKGGGAPAEATTAQFRSRRRGPGRPGAGSPPRTSRRVAATGPGRTAPAAATADDRGAGVAASPRATGRPRAGRPLRPTSPPRPPRRRLAPAPAVPAPGPAAAQPPPWRRWGATSRARRASGRPSTPADRLLDEGPTAFLEAARFAPPPRDRRSRRRAGRAPAPGRASRAPARPGRPRCSSSGSTRGRCSSSRSCSRWCCSSSGWSRSACSTACSTAWACGTGSTARTPTWCPARRQTGSTLISAGRVFGLAAVVGAINSLLFAVAVTVGAFVYNVSADLVGGIEVTLSERD